MISVDAGPMHVAAAVGTPTLAVVGNDAVGIGASPIRLWKPRNKVVERTVMREGANYAVKTGFETMAACR